MPIGLACNDLSNLVTIKVSAIILFTGMVVSGIAQNKSDYIWITGNNSRSTDGIESYCLNFNNDSIVEECESALEYDRNNASYCDEEGNLLFYSNGCAIADGNHKILPNGDSINYGEFFELYWGNDCANGYPGTQDIIALPDPGDPNGYYLVHKPIMVEREDSLTLEINHLNYSYIQFENNQGQVTKKNITILEDDMMLSYLTAINHSNGKDWWIIQPVNDTNIYLTILLDDNGFHLVSKQSIGPVFHYDASGAGVARFSPDGKKYAYYNGNDGLLLYDFNRVTGELSNLKALYIPDQGMRFSCIEFSSNAQFIYNSSFDVLYQIDLSYDDLNDGLLLIDTWDGTIDPLPTGFYLSQLGPDCKIYINSGSSVYTYHVINNPNLKGKACNFVQRQIRLPHVSPVGNFPNFPRFRVDEDEVCDSTLTSVFNTGMYTRMDMHVFPNPAISEINVQLPKAMAGRLSIYDLSGNECISKDIGSATTTITVDISQLASAAYITEFYPRYNVKQIVFTGRFIKS